MIGSIMKKVTIESISVDLSDWKVNTEEEGIKIWINDFGDQFSINYFTIEPSFPKDGDIHSLRHFYRDIVIQSKGAILEVEMDQIRSLFAIRTIFKFPQDPTGFTYIASFTIPRAEFSFVLKVVCPEYGMTGVRESMIILVAENQGLVKKGTFEGWLADPYDPEFQSEVLSNIGDREMYDTKFPKHPLSRARKMLKYVKDKVIIGEEIIASEAFDFNF